MIVTVPESVSGLPKASSVEYVPTTVTRKMPGFGAEKLIETEQDVPPVEHDAGENVVVIAGPLFALNAMESVANPG